MWLGFSHLLKVKLIAFADGWKRNVRERGVKDNWDGFWLEALEGTAAIDQAGKSLTVWV